MSTKLRKATAENDQGFTLIELLVVIIIIGILAAIAIPVFLNQRKKAVDASLKSDLKSAALSMESWRIGSTTYHPSVSGYFVLPNAMTLNLSPRGADLDPAFEFRGSPGNTVRLVRATPSGYCLQATNPGSSDPDDGFYYGSFSGGLLPKGSTCEFDAGY